LFSFGQNTWTGNVNNQWDLDGNWSFGHVPTGFEEVMNGRVKTLHPNIHMALLARGYEKSDLDTLEKFDLQPIDLVVGNLYAFEQALKDGAEDQAIT